MVFNCKKNRDYCIICRSNQVQFCYWLLVGRRWRLGCNGSLNSNCCSYYYNKSRGSRFFQNLINVDCMKVSIVVIFVCNFCTLNLFSSKGILLISLHTFNVKHFLQKKTEKIGNYYSKQTTILHKLYAWALFENF